MSIFFTSFSVLNKNNNNNNTHHYAKIKRIKLTDNDGWHQIARPINSRIYEIFLASIDIKMRGNERRQYVRLSRARVNQTRL
jgi:hypothetical protein